MVIRDVIFLNADTEEDGKGERFGAMAEIDCPTELEIWQGDQFPYTLVGRIGNIRRVDKTYTGDFYILLEYKEPETLKHMFPSVNGFISKRVGCVIMGAKITRITMCMENADKRIKKLGDYVVSNDL